MKGSYQHYVIPLCHTFNLSFTDGIDPYESKLAKVMYKSGSQFSINNYRPISVLRLFPKILERLVYNCFNSYLTKHDLIYDNQFGFRTSHSTNLALSILVDRIL